MTEFKPVRHWRTAWDGLRSWWWDRRGSAGIELALGSVVLISGSAMMFDLYRQASSHAALERAVVTMADYASREDEPEAVFLNDLAGYLHFSQLEADSTATFVVTAAAEDSDSADPGDGQVLWKWLATVGEAAAHPPTGLGEECSRIAGAGQPVQLASADFAFDSGEAIVIAEACLGWSTPFPGVGLGSPTAYAAYVLPHRGETEPAPPSGDTHEHAFAVQRASALPNAPGWPGGPPLDDNLTDQRPPGDGLDGVPPLDDHQLPPGDGLDGGSPLDDFILGEDSLEAK